MVCGTFRDRHRNKTAMPEKTSVVGNAILPFDTLGEQGEMCGKEDYCTRVESYVQGKISPVRPTITAGVGTVYAAALVSDISYCIPAGGRRQGVWLTAPELPDGAIPRLSSLCDSSATWKILIHRTRVC